LDLYSLRPALLNGFFATVLTGVIYAIIAPSINMGLF
jgi:hypothetical protein